MNAGELCVPAEAYDTLQVWWKALLGAAAPSVVQDCGQVPTRMFYPRAQYFPIYFYRISKRFTIIPQSTP